MRERYLRLLLIIWLFWIPFQQTSAQSFNIAAQSSLPENSLPARLNHTLADKDASTITSTMDLNTAEAIVLAAPVMRYAELEQLALEHNPTLKQAQDAIKAVEARGLQSGLLPNPIVGYMGEDFSLRNFSQGSKHMFFVEQRIPLGGKLSKNRKIFYHEADQARANYDLQHARVLNSIRLLYYEALSAQRMVELKGNLAKLALEAVDISAQLYNVGQADKPDQLEIEIEAAQIETELFQAVNDWEQTWRAIGALVGQPELIPARLEGSLEFTTANLDQTAMLTTLLEHSPEIKVALAGVERARAALVRARAERIPDLFIRGGYGYNNEKYESKNGIRKIGPEGFIETGITLPIFNRNQGGIAAAEAEVRIAEQEVIRRQLSLRARFAQAFRSYRNSLLKIERYNQQILPRAQTAYQMYLTSFGQMAASYPQVLIAQRTLFQTQVEYVKELTELQRNLTNLRGFMLTGGLDALSTDTTEASIFSDNSVNGE